jgi:hypothetical protein
MRSFFIHATLALVLLGCDSSASWHQGQPDGGGPRGDAAYEAPPLICADASPRDAATNEVPVGPLLCGGEVAVAGLTHFGWWAPRTAKAVMQLGACHGLALSFGDAPPTDGPTLFVHIKEAKTTEAWSGTFQAKGTLVGGGNFQLIPVTVEITSATALFGADAAAPTMTGAGPIGNVTGRIDADTGCGHVTGTFSVPYCAWTTCAN